MTPTELNKNNKILHFKKTTEKKKTQKQHKLKENKKFN